MDMKIDSKLVIKERNDRAWSQQHLASASSLSLRTIQRVEKSSLSSKDSLQAISSAFDKEPVYFLGKEGLANKNKYSLKFYALCTSFVFAILGGFLFSPVSAKTVGLKINYESKNLESSDENQGVWEYLVTIGSESRFELPNNFVLNILPRINSDKEIELSTELRSATGEPLIPNSADPVVSGILSEGVNISYEKGSKLIVAITISELNDITKQ